MRLIDLSHVIEHGMITYPGLPGPVIEDHLSFEASVDHYAAGTEFAIGRISMVANTGTYLDTPAHRHRDGHDLSGLPLERCAMVPAVVIDADAAAIGAEALAVEAVRIMESRRITQILVTDRQRHLVGALHFHDLLAAKVV